MRDPIATKTRQIVSSAVSCYSGFGFELEAILHVLLDLYRMEESSGRGVGRQQTEMGQWVHDYDTRRDKELRIGSTYTIYGLSLLAVRERWD